MCVCARSCSTPRNESASKRFLFTQTFRLQRSDRWQVQKYTWRQNWSLMLLLTFYLRIKSKKCLSHLKYLGGRNKEQQQNFLSFEWGDQINLDDPGKSRSIKKYKKDFGFYIQLCRWKYLHLNTSCRRLGFLTAAYQHSSGWRNSNLDLGNLKVISTFIDKIRFESCQLIICSLLI